MNFVIISIMSQKLVNMNIRMSIMSQKLVNMNIRIEYLVFMSQF